MESVNHSKNGTLVDAQSYSFDHFQIDPVNRMCSRDGQPLPVSGKVYEILLYFVENPGRLLTKEELLENVWRDDFVEEGNLARNVSTLRKLLGDTDKNHKYIVTVAGHGYRFIADVRRFVDDRSSVQPLRIQNTSEYGSDLSRSSDEAKPHKLLWAMTAVIVLFTVAWFGKDRFFTASPTVKTLAVLPLRGIDPNDNSIGVGISDAVIRQISSSGQVTVRPTSAVLHYLNQDTDSLAAARELNADAVLEGTVQRSADKFRVSVNLIRTADGTSIWNNSFNLSTADIFQVQDDVAQQVAQSLKVRLGNNSKYSIPKYPADPVAYEWYMKGLYSLDLRRFDKSDLPHMLDTIDYFEQSTKADPNCAIAHAQLAFSYAWMAIFVDPEEPKWADMARQEISRAEELDPNVAESHVAKGLLFWSAYGGFQVESAIRELRLAKQLDPNISSADLAALYGHAGLESQANDEWHRAAAIDPTSQALRGLIGILPYLRGDVNGWLAAYPNARLEDRPLSRWYYMQTGQLDLAESVIKRQLEEAPVDYDIFANKAVLTALRGDFAGAEASLPAIFAKVPHNDESYHHETYQAACIYALEGNSMEAVKWLRETANSGFPNYPLFARDKFLDRIRQSPEFIQFLAEQKAQWERFEQEFPDA